MESPATLLHREDLPASGILAVPDVTLVAWIPFAKTLEDLGAEVAERWGQVLAQYNANQVEGAWKRSRPKLLRRAAVELLFNSGNPPPGPFSSVQSFCEFANGSTEYRGWLALLGLTIDVRSRRIVREPQPARPLGANRRNWAPQDWWGVGYTKICGYFWGWRISRLPELLVSEMAGDGAAQSDITPVESANGTRTDIRASAWFKVGTLADLGAWVMTGYWAASVWAELTVSVFWNSHYEIRIAASAIPNLSIQVGWPHQPGSRRYLRDMKRNSIGEDLEFMRAPGCKSAPEVPDLRLAS